MAQRRWRSQHLVCQRRNKHPQTPTPTLPKERLAPELLGAEAMAPGAAQTQLRGFNVHKAPHTHVLLIILMKTLQSWS